MGDSKAIVNGSFIWFNKDSSVKLRESTNYTNSVLRSLHCFGGEAGGDERTAVEVGPDDAGYHEFFEAIHNDNGLEGKAIDGLQTWGSVLFTAAAVTVVAIALYLMQRKRYGSPKVAPGRTQPQLGLRAAPSTTQGA